MEIIIVGGGKQGFQLAKHCNQLNHQITVIDNKLDKIEMIKEKLDVNLLLGDGTNKETLAEAGAETADMVVAVTNSDQNNLVVCQLAERQFDVAKTLTSINNPGNEKLFEWLGVNQVISSTSMMLGVITDDIDLPNTKDLWANSLNELKMHYIQIDDDSPTIEQQVKDIPLPDEAILITILRDDEAIVPRGKTVIKANDTVIALAEKKIKTELLEIFNHPQKEFAS